VTATATLFHADTVSVGYGFACALRDGGRAFCWGANHDGQLGNGTVGEPVYVPGPVAGDLAFAAVTTSGTHACGLTAEGVAYCWGSNASGELGIGAAGVGVPTPTPAQTALTFTRISADGVTGDNTVCALTEAGEAWCWGSNRRGRLGDGTTNDSPVPVRVQSDVPFTAIRSGTDHSCGTAAGGELWCWGEQESTPGALGARPAGGYPTPVLVLEDFEFVSMSLGWNYACGLTAQQSALCWGTNWFGGLGNASSDGSDVPLPVDGGHAFVAISAAGYKETHGLTTDGLIYRWGTSGTEAPEPTPILVTGHRFVMIESGEEPFDGWYGACGLSAGNAVYCVRDDGLVRGVPAPAGP
jgi:alpha-tubulin suppressor-like RCC1 family protein